MVSESRIKSAAVVRDAGNGSPHAARQPASSLTAAGSDQKQGSAPPGRGIIHGIERSDLDPFIPGGQLLGTLAAGDNRNTGVLRFQIGLSNPLEILCRNLKNAGTEALTQFRGTPEQTGVIGLFRLTGGRSGLVDGADHTQYRFFQLARLNLGILDPAGGRVKVIQGSLNTRIAVGEEAEHRIAAVLRRAGTIGAALLPNRPMQIVVAQELAQHRQGGRILMFTGHRGERLGAEIHLGAGQPGLVHGAAGGGQAQRRKGAGIFSLRPVLRQIFTERLAVFILGHQQEAPRSRLHLPVQSLQPCRQ